MPRFGDFIITTKGFLLSEISPKDILGKLSFLHTLFLEHEVQITN